MIKGYTKFLNLGGLGIYFSLSLIQLERLASNLAPTKERLPRWAIDPEKCKRKLERQETNYQEEGIASTLDPVMNYQKMLKHQKSR